MIKNNEHDTKIVRKHHQPMQGNDGCHEGKQNKTTLPAAITEQALHQFEQRINESIRLNAKQEKLKADLKEQTGIEDKR